jgi:myo-inositol-1(or 4)-monophosphatase
MQKVESKGVGDLVCEVDRMADVAATQVLRRHSTSAILSEELNPDVEPGQGELWIVDPLDGSSAFLVRAGIHFPSVLVALCRDGEPVLGVTLFPLTGEWFYAEKGRGAFKDGQALVIADTDEDLSDVWVEMNQYGDSQYETPIFDSLRRQLRTDRGALLVTISAPNAGVAMRIAESNRLLAAVVHDNNPKSIKQAAWDIAPIKVIFEEAGGVFVNHDGGLVDPFVPEPFVVAKTRRLADQILALL